MTPADRLRSLVKEATPGPWQGKDNRYGGLVRMGDADSDTERLYTRTVPDARLIALAPQLAELVVDMAEALTDRRPDGTMKQDLIREALARLAALFPEDSA